jgi:hypothetical protein
MEKPSKLKFENVSPYLPYGLKCMYKNEVFEMTSLFRPSKLSINHLFYKKVWPVWADDSSEFNHDYLHKKSCCGKGHSLKDIKPILRPLSDLLNPEFRQIAHDLGADIDYEAAVYDIQRGWTKQHLYEILLQNHFDVFGLIDAGLAIDYNTLVQHEKVVIEGKEFFKTKSGDKTLYSMKYDWNKQIKDNE